MVRLGRSKRQVGVLALAVALAMVSALAALADYRASAALSHDSPLAGSSTIGDLGAIAGLAAVLVALVSLNLTWRERRSRRRSERRMARLVQGIDQADALVTIVGRKGQIEYVNRAVEEATGYAGEELLKPRAGRWFPWYAEERAFEEVRDELLAGRSYRGTVPCRRKDGTAFLLEEHIAPMQEGKESPERYVSTARDVTQQRSLEERLSQLDRFDPLTGLPHRRHFTELLESELAQEVGGSSGVAVLVMDLERFKYINDVFSTEVGDEMLRHVAGVLRELAGPRGTVGRLGSDEFGVIQPSATPAVEGPALAQRILGALARETNIGGHDVTATLSVGVALSPAHGSDAGTLMKNADTALLFAKSIGRKGRNGRDAMHIFSQELRDRAVEEYAIQRRVAAGFHNGEYRIHYQPYCDLSTGRIAGAEALMRWDSRELGSVSPGKFIPVLEESGLIVEVGEWVLRSACRQLRDWRAAYPPLPVAVNLSPVQFGHRDLVGLVADAVREHEIDPRYLTLELTESICTHDVGFTADLLGKLKGVGVSISIDDFGTGYSSLSYVKRLPADNLKIDMSFVRDVTRDPDAASIVTAITGMARGLGRQTIAEGVETEEQRKVLHLLRCDLGQGFHFGRPVAPEELARQLAMSSAVAPAVPPAAPLPERLTEPPASH
jgi:diguanylate cyclase (GGDEF)-like protein/PAS domain S-box-containing protein